MFKVPHASRPSHVSLWKGVGMHVCSPDGWRWKIPKCLLGRTGYYLIYEKHPLCLLSPLLVSTRWPRVVFRNISVAYRLFPVIDISALMYKEQVCPLKSEMTFPWCCCIVVIVLTFAKQTQLLQSAGECEAARSVPALPCFVHDSKGAERFQISKHINSVSLLICLYICPSGFQLEPKPKVLSNHKKGCLPWGF